MAGAVRQMAEADMSGLEKGMSVISAPGLSFTMHMEGVWLKSCQTIPNQDSL